MARHPKAAGGDVPHLLFEVVSLLPHRTPAVDDQDHVAAGVGRKPALGAPAPQRLRRVDAELTEASLPLVHQ